MGTCGSCTCETVQRPPAAYRWGRSAGFDGRLAWPRCGRLLAQAGPLPRGGFLPKQERRTGAVCWEARHTLPAGPGAASTALRSGEQKGQWAERPRLAPVPLLECQSAWLPVGGSLRLGNVEHSSGGTEAEDPAWGSFLLARGHYAFAGRDGQGGEGQDAVACSPQHPDRAKEAE